MPNPSVPPPLRVRNPAGTFNQIPVFELEVSGATLTKISPIRTQLLIDSGAGGTGAPTDAPYVTYSANASLTAERILTAGSSVTLVTDATAIYVNALTGGGGTTVYAATGNQYVTISAAADLTDEYIIRSSTGVSLTSAGNVLLVHYGSLLVTTSRSISTLYPVAGGGDFSADRTFSVDTSFLITSARTINTTLPLSGGGTLAADRTFTIVTANNDTAGALAAADFKLFSLGRVSTDRTITTIYPLTGGGLNLSADRTFSVDTAFLVTSARTLTAGVGLTGGGNLGADRTVDLFTGGAGQYVITSIGATEGIAWINTTAAGGVVYAPTGGEYITWATNADLTNERTLESGTGIQISTSTTTVTVNVRTGGVAGQYFITSAGAPAGVAWVATAGAGGATTKTLRIPLALLTVQPDLANAFWLATTGTNVDMAAVRFVDSGEGISTYWGIVPENVAATPAWNLYFYSKMPTATAANSAMVSVRAKAIADGEDANAAAYTTVASAGLYRIYRSTTMTISAVSGGNFDTPVALTSGDFLTVEVNRHGGNASDSLSDHWDLCGLMMRVDVTG